VAAAENVVQAWIGHWCGLGRKEESTSFLKKRSKKLLLF